MLWSSKISFAYFAFDCQSHGEQFNIVWKENLSTFEDNHEILSCFFKIISLAQYVDKRE